MHKKRKKEKKRKKKVHLKSMGKVGQRRLVGRTGGPKNPCPPFAASTTSPYLE
jgi:hypothetical protein